MPVTKNNVFVYGILLTVKQKIKEKEGEASRENSTGFFR